MREVLLYAIAACIWTALSTLNLRTAINSGGWLDYLLLALSLVCVATCLWAVAGKAKKLERAA